MENENIVKATCKELGITQKELAERMGVAEVTINKWAQGVTKIPKWALKMFDLLMVEKKYNTLKQILPNS